MEVSTPYDDLKGIVAADVSNLSTTTNRLEELAEAIEIDTERYNVIGLDIYGIGEFFVKLIAIDKEKSNEEKEHLVTIAIDDQENLKRIFKDLHIVLVNKFKQQYLKRKIDEKIDIEED